MTVGGEGGDVCGKNRAVSEMVQKKCVFNIVSM